MCAKDGQMRKAILMAFALVMIASPAFALVCKATDEGGNTYTAIGAQKGGNQGAAFLALKQCRENSDAPETCKIVSCSVSG